MARGWESKSVEAQQAEAIEGSGKPRSRLSAEQAARERKKENLRLARQRVLQQLQTATNDGHRKVLGNALADLEDKLGRLNH